MTAINNILVPIDYSSNSRHAFFYAAKLAELTGATITVHHTCSPLHDPTVGLEQEKEKLLGYAEAIIYEEGLGKPSLEVHVSEGVNLENITESDFFQAIDLVVMGTRGASGLKKMFLGSNTVHLIENTSKPVLVIPENYVYQPVHHVLFCTDQQEMDVAALTPLKNLALASKADIRMAHIYTDDKHSSEEEVEERIKEIEFFEPEVTCEYKRIFHHDFDSGVDFYNSFKGNNGMIAIVSRQHTFFENLFSESHTRAMAFDPDRPLLVMHDQL